MTVKLSGVLEIRWCRTHRRTVLKARISGTLKDRFSGVFGRTAIPARPL
ncbi:hypothetical protein HMPREF0185_00057 [Brevundimonas diminuta 470-4]|nr:hypothetical protein HMPREF0185_00057 [Brevundimonas diminuta 470-4]